ncbi:MAG: aldo/keto reductase [bacterium]|nr:aldo/keto reductase [bacterium]
MGHGNEQVGEHGLTRRDFIRGGAALAAGVALGFTPTQIIRAANPGGADTSGILSYNPEMEYRRLGKTGLMVSAACLGGHWKRVDMFIGGEKNAGWGGDISRPEFQKNRADVVSRCIERGINYVDACSELEIAAYSRALKGRREQMYLGWSPAEHESRNPEYRTAAKLMETFDKSLKDTGEEYVDLWRITGMQDGKTAPDGKHIMAHDERESEQIAKALELARKSGRARATGVSSHDRLWLEYMMNTFPEQIEVVVSPYTAKSKVLPKESFFDTVRKCGCGFLGIKPFASNSLFKGNSAPDSPTFEEDNRLARLAIRYILCNPAITAPIPGMVSVQQVDNVALAIKEHRELDETEKAALDTAMEVAWNSLPADYEWLKRWEYV